MLLEFERTAKRILQPLTSPGTRRRIIAARDSAVGLVAGGRSRLPGERQLPGLLIAGAQKAGTTYLDRQLARHPEIGVPLTKELHFFDDRHHRGPAWYGGHFARRGRYRLTIEASPGYMFHPHAPGRIAATLPEVRVVLLLRDPLRRAHSHYLHERRLGFETASTFEEAIDLEPARVEPDLRRIEQDESAVGFAWRHCSYLSRGHYLDQVRRCHRALGRDRVLVLRSEDMYARPAQTVARVVEFAGLEPWVPERFAPNDMAATGGPRLAGATRERLAEYFRPHNEALAEYLGTDVWW
ncbi:sulfotransferase domain-containing protein [Georgenia alba]|uniref:Sulfotransferase domain-containing protein n=1 Tax=Georgenia alba TaxID=2233858 RepID=A0ABW2Q4V6_9MICO